MRHEDRADLEDIDHRSVIIEKRKAMENSSDLSFEITVRPGDLYEAFGWSWQNVARWVLVLFVGYLVFETHPVWSAASTVAGVRDALVALSLFGLFALLALFLFPYLRLRHAFRKYPGRQWTQQFSFGTKGVHIDAEDASGDYLWSFFDSITETSKNILFRTKHGSAVYIPKHRVPNRDDVTRLRGLIRQNFKGRMELRHD